MSRQPKWVYLGNFGDADPLSYGGLFVYADATGAYAPEAHRVQPWDEYHPPADSDLRGKYEVHSFIIDRFHRTPGGRVGDNPHHVTEPVWFDSGDKLESVARSVGRTAEQLRDDLMSSDPFDRLRVLEAVAGYFGWDNFDSYPTTMTRAEVRRRFPAPFRARRRVTRP